MDLAADGGMHVLKDRRRRRGLGIAEDDEDDVLKDRRPRWGLGIAEDDEDDGRDREEPVGGEGYLEGGPAGYGISGPAGYGIGGPAGYGIGGPAGYGIGGPAGYGIGGPAGYGIGGPAGYGIGGPAGYGISGPAGYGIGGLAGYGIRELKDQRPRRGLRIAEDDEDDVLKDRPRRRGLGIAEDEEDDVLKDRRRRRGLRIAEGCLDLMDRGLRKAADEGDVQGLQELVAVKPDVIYYRTRTEKNTALHIAASKGHTLFVHHFLLYMGMDGELMVSQNIDGDTPMHLVVKAGHLEVVEHLLQYLAWARGIDAKFQDPTMMTNNEGGTPLHDALLHRKSDVAIELLRQNPDTIGIVDIMGRNAFHIAATNDMVKVLALLLKCEVSDEILNQQDRDGNTPLHHAAKLCQREPIRWLLNDRRINPLVINKDGHTAWAYQITRDLVAQIPRVVMDQALRDAIDKGDVLSLVNLLASSPDMVYSVTLNETNTALHLAASKGNDWIVHHVLFYTNLNVGIIASENVDQDTPLHLAARVGHLEVVHHLIRYVKWAREIDANLKIKKPLTMQNKKGNTPLHEAVVHGRYLVAVELLEGAMEALVTMNGDGDTPLHLAVQVGDLELVNMLIIYAKEMNLGRTTQYTEGPTIMTNKEGDTPLHQAVLLRKSDIALKLLEANPSCGHMSNAGMHSPLYIAVRDSLTHVVKKIASQGLSEASISPHGTALHQCVVANNIRALEILLDKYAELVESTDSSGNNALHYAAQYNNARIVSILLKKNSTLPYTQNNKRQTPLHEAAMHESMEAAKELLKQCPDVSEIVDEMGQNALHIAVTRNKMKMLELLLKYVLPEGIVNQQDKDGNTPLHHAAKLCRLQPTTLLLLNDWRVNPCLVNKDGDTAFALSGKKGILMMNAHEFNLWKTLKKHESRRCKQQWPMAQQLGPRPLRKTYIEKIMETHVLVATLMLVATLAVTLAMPGGYSRQLGTAIVGHHQAFKIFVVCNSISICGSTVVVLCFIWGSLVRYPELSVLLWTNRLVLLSGLTMIMSMLTAVYLTITPASQWVAYVVIAIGASTPFLGCLISRNSMVPTNWWWLGTGECALCYRAGSTLGDPSPGNTP